MHGNTIEAIQKIRNYRRDTKIPLCFTLDAGPNIHLLFPKKYRHEVTGFVEKDLKSLLEKGKYIKDETGSGPLQLI
jgi:diphosphomevalonate decarboxylase